MEIFIEKADFFQLKELEKIAPKEKGISKLQRTALSGVSPPCSSLHVGEGRATVTGR